MTGRARTTVGLGGPLALALAACSTPTPTLVLRLTGGLSQQCPSTDCNEVGLPCRAVINIRIADPGNMSQPWLDQCVEIEPDLNRSMCALGGVKLDPVPLPVHDLEVNVAVYPASMIPANPLNLKELQCPKRVEFSAATGFPVEQWPTPALGGRAFYHPGDETVTVDLGCTDLEAIEQSCATSETVTVTATVDDFETRASVSGGVSGTASHLLVSVGEPQAIDGGVVLRADRTRALARVASIDGSDAVPTWQNDVDLVFEKYVCVDVIETVAQTTAVVRCRPVNGDSRIDMTGMRIARENLQALLTALAPQSEKPVTFPDEGLTVGLVVDQVSVGIAGVVVTSAEGSVKYMNPQGMLTGSATSSAGIFVSHDAPFGTMFAAGGPGRPTMTAIGGRIAGKVTLVVLQLGNEPR